MTQLILTTRSPTATTTTTRDGEVRGLPTRSPCEPPVDVTRYWICPTGTPLYYTPVYRRLSPAQKLRYNQLAAISFAQLTAFFERTFTASLVQVLTLRASIDKDLTARIERFVAEEAEHAQIWDRLARDGAGVIESAEADPLFVMPTVADCVLRKLTRRPHWFSVVFWMMLLLEEHSLDISRRSLTVPQSTMDPAFREFLRSHQQDEMRHVAIDRLLIERFYENAAPAIRKLNAAILAATVRHFIVPPTRSAVRVVDLLVHGDDGLRCLQPVMKRQLRALAHDHDYQHMMFSRQTTPILFSLFDRYPEMRVLQNTLASYDSQPSMQSHG